MLAFSKITWAALELVLASYVPPVVVRRKEVPAISCRARAQLKLKDNTVNRYYQIKQNKDGGGGSFFLLLFFIFIFYLFIYYY